MKKLFVLFGFIGTVSNFAFAQDAKQGTLFSSGLNVTCTTAHLEFQMVSRAPKHGEIAKIFEVNPIEIVIAGKVDITVRAKSNRAIVQHFTADDLTDPREASSPYFASDADFIFALAEGDSPRQFRYNKLEIVQATCKIERQ